MEQPSGEEFVGIVEFLQEEPSYNYCCIRPGCAMVGSEGIGMIGYTIAKEYGDQFRNRITFQPPQGIDRSGEKNHLCAKRYHPLSVMERHLFEKAVLAALKGKK